MFDIALAQHSQQQPFFFFLLGIKNKECQFLEAWKMEEQQQVKVMHLMLELPWKS